MIRCPACDEPGIREHSVLVSVDAMVAARDASSAGPPEVYSRCVACGALFARRSRTELLSASAQALGTRQLWIVPPWKEDGDRSSFEVSWDVVDAFFEERRPQVEWLGPLVELIGELRRRGFDATLRAGQSLNDLVLSRAREHGLGPGQGALFLKPQLDGAVVVDGVIDSEPVRFGPVPARFDGALREAIERLAKAPVD